MTTTQEKTEPASVSTDSPNLYELHGAELHITYSTTSIDGTPRFTFQDATRALNFVGDQIRTVATEIGSLVTVTTCRTIDSGSATFTLVVPRINLGSSHQSPIDTVGITTIHRFSVLPALNRGQIELYKVTPLTGAASLVAF